MFAALFASLFLQGMLLGLAALALLAAAPGLQKRYGPRWLCRLWVALAVLFLVPLRVLLPQAPAAVSVDTTLVYSRTDLLSQEVTEKPADGVPYAVVMNETTDTPAGYIVPRTELQTGRRTVLERLAIGATRLDLLALVWNLGVLAVAVYQFGGYAVWRIRVRRTAQPVAASWRDALPQGQCPHMQATPLVRSPMVAGVFSPLLLVPAGEAPDGAAYMLAHELTHIKRHDVAKKLLFTLACIAHWYNPAVWMLAARAGRDIEEACDAETLQGHDAAYRAAYADALMTAVRRNRGPAMTSGFALNKRQFKQRLAALWDTAPKRRGRALLAALTLAACCVGGLVACKPADTTVEDKQEPAATATPAVSESLDPNRRNPADPEYLNLLSTVATRAADYWQARLDADSYRYLTARVGMSGVVDPDDDADLSYLLDYISTDGDTDYRAQVDAGDAFVVKVSFYVVYSPEIDYLGPQYTDGTNSVYIFTPVNENVEIRQMSGWNPVQTGSVIPEISDEARTLQLNEWQYTMLVHQCRALAAAGITGFTNFADLTDEQTACYLAARGQDYGMTDAIAWPGKSADEANMLLAIDFTDDEDVWGENTQFFAIDWPGFGDVPPTLPDTPNYSWTYERDGEAITATGSVEGTAAVQYTFSVYPGSELKFNARTVIVSGRSLS